MLKISFIKKNCPDSLNYYTTYILPLLFTYVLLFCVFLWKAVTDLCAKQIRSTIVFMCSFHFFMCSFHLVMRSFHLVMCFFHSVMYSFHYWFFLCALYIRCFYALFFVLFLCILFMCSFMCCFNVLLS